MTKRLLVGLLEPAARRAIAVASRRVTAKMSRLRVSSLGHAALVARNVPRQRLARDNSTQLDPPRRPRGRGSRGARATGRSYREAQRLDQGHAAERYDDPPVSAVGSRPRPARELGGR